MGTAWSDDRLGGFPAPEAPDSINRVDLGNLKLSPEEGMALIQFMKSLTDISPGAL